MEPGFQLPDGMVEISKDEARRRLGIKPPAPAELEDDLAWVDEWQATHEKTECTQEELDEIDNHPFFMRDMPEDPTSNPHLAAFRELVVGDDQTPDEIAENLKQSANEFLRDRFQDPRGATQAIRDAVQRYSDALRVAGVTPCMRAVVLSNRSQAHLYLKNFRSAGQDAAQAEKILGQAYVELSKRAAAGDEGADAVAEKPEGVAKEDVGDAQGEGKADGEGETTAEGDGTSADGEPKKKKAGAPTVREVLDLRVKVLVRLVKAAADAPGNTASATSLSRATAGVQRALSVLQTVQAQVLEMGEEAHVAEAPPPPPVLRKPGAPAPAPPAPKATPAEAVAGGIRTAEEALTKLRKRLEEATAAEAAAEEKEKSRTVQTEHRVTRAEAALMAWGVVWARDVSDEVSDVCFGQWQQRQRPFPSIHASADEGIAAAKGDVTAALLADRAAVTVPVVVRWPEPRTEDFVADVLLSLPLEDSLRALLPPAGPPPPFDPTGREGFVWSNVEFYVASNPAAVAHVAKEGVGAPLTQDALIAACAAEPLDADAARTRVRLDTTIPLGDSLSAAGHVLRGQGTLVVYGVRKGSKLVEGDVIKL